MALAVLLMKSCTCIFFGLSAWVSLAAQESYTVKQLVQRALAKSQAIQAQEKQVQAFSGAIRQAETGQNPSLSVNTGRKNETGSSGSTYSLNLSQPFYFPGKSGLRTQIQKNLQTDANLDLHIRRREIYQRVIELAFAYKETVEHTRHLAERRQQFKLMRKYLNSRPFISAQSKLAKAIISNRIRLLEKESLSEEARQESTWEQLNFYLHLDQPIAIQTKWFTKGIPLDREELRQQLQNNPLVHKHKKAWERKGLEKSLAQKEKYPDFSISAKYSQERAQQLERSWGAGVSLNLPLWDRKQGKIAQYQSELAALSAKSTELEQRLRSELNVAYIEYENSRQVLQKYPLSLLEKMHRQVAFANREFRKGRVEVLTYMELENSSSEIHLAVFDAQIEYVQSYLKILALTGQMNFQEESQ